ncbi:MAG TPA: hypothetical protein DEP42_03810 [Ruminococcaceae bacterium]|nr:hypothetical protein [Oscillospiraceae bacterium]
MNNRFAASLKKNKYGMLIMILSAAFTAFGQYFWKSSQAGSGSSLLLMFIGFVFYGFGALTMILAFRYGSLSVLHPMLSLGYIFGMIISVVLLGEAIDVFKIIGLLFILFGVTMVGVGDE